MTAAELAAWRKENKCSQKDLAKALGVHAITVTRWETEARAIPPFLPLALETIERRNVIKPRKPAKKKGK